MSTMPRHIDKTKLYEDYCNRGWIAFSVAYEKNESYRESEYILV